ncbi:MAG: hypothetical protein ACI9J3_003259 [Parvicellaceae bacterium]|jgi:hypothetical protein
MKTSNGTRIFKVVMGILIIAFVLLLTIKYIKVIPPVIKVLALIVNAAVIYLSYTGLIKQKK